MVAKTICHLVLYITQPNNIKMNNEIKHITKAINAAKESVDVMKLNNSRAKNGRYENFDELINKNAYIDEYINNISSHENIVQAREFFAKIEESKDFQTERLLNEINKHRVRGKRSVLKYVASIAAALFFISFAIWKTSNERLPEINNVVLQDAGVKDSPTLILASGKSVNLNKLADDTISEEDICEIQRAGKDNLTYIAQNQTIDTLKYNTLVVPKMYTYAITLSDGTEVHLNANSELEYPVVFAGNSRKVHLKGEAFFKVKKGVIPFIVEVENIDVKVYGTEFNINTHKKDIVETTLISGSVGISFDKNESAEIKIKPNEMFVQNIKTGEREVKAVVATNYTAWLNGKFMSIKEPLDDLLIAISNWYDVDFVYETNIIKDMKISAILSRNYPIDKVIKIIESTVDIQFIKEGGKYIIVEK